MSSPLIKFDKVKKAFNGNLVLDEIDLEIFHGFLHLSGDIHQAASLGGFDTQSFHGSASTLKGGVVLTRGIINQSEMAVLPIKKGFSALFLNRTPFDITASLIR